MVLCPIALAVGCRRCPAFSVCPVKSVIGDYKPGTDDDDAIRRGDAPARAKVVRAAASSKRKQATNRKGARARRPRK
jgi:hypothetical protein